MSKEEKKAAEHVKELEPIVNAIKDGIVVGMATATICKKVKSPETMDKVIKELEKYRDGLKSEEMG